MIKNGKILKEYENSLARQEGPIPAEKSFQIFSAMWQEALNLGVVPFKDPWAGIETKIKLAKILNTCLKK